MSNALQAVLDRAKQAPDDTARKPAASAPVRAKAAKPLEPTAPPTEQPGPARHSRPVRAGKRFVGAHFHPEVARQLKMLAAEDGTTIQELLEQAVDLLFVKAGKAKIAQLTQRT